MRLKTGKKMKTHKITSITNKFYNVSMKIEHINETNTFLIHF